MSRHYWITVFAFGLILFASIGSAQDEAQSEQGQIQKLQKPAQTLPIPLPVDIVEDEATADARRRNEVEARQRQIEDLIAQKGMNAATQAMNEATQKMAVYNRYSTILVGVGTFLLFVTLWLTHQANKSAREAVGVTQDIGQRQLRAYIGVVSGELLIRGAPPNQIVHFHVALKNTGQTPAYGFTTWIKGPVIDVTDAYPYTEPRPMSERTGSSIVAPGGDIHINQPGPLSNADIFAVDSGEKRIFIWGGCDFTDAFGKPRYFRFKCTNGGRSANAAGQPDNLWSIQPHKDGYEAN